MSCTAESSMREKLSPGERTLPEVPMVCDEDVITIHSNKYSQKETIDNMSDAVTNETENVNIHSPNNTIIDNRLDSDDEVTVKSKKPHKSGRILDDDSEEDNIENEEIHLSNELKDIPQLHLDSDEDNTIQTTKSYKLRQIIDDTEDETESKNNQSGSGSDFDEDINVHDKTSRMIRQITDEEINETENVDIHLLNNEIKENTSNKAPFSSYKNMFQNTDIYDAEGSSDEEERCTSPDYKKSAGDRSILKDKDQNKISKKRAGPQRKSKQNALEEIHSETQRLIRESRVSLPYHRSKQRSLSEFLNRRKSIPAVSLKTTADQLSKVWQHLEEREKTTESFYKSETDSSEDELKEVTSSLEKPKNTEDNISENAATQDATRVEESSVEKIVSDSDCRSGVPISSIENNENEELFDISSKSFSDCLNDSESLGLGIHNNLGSNNEIIACDNLKRNLFSDENENQKAEIIETAVRKDQNDSDKPTAQNSLDVFDISNTFNSESLNHPNHENKEENNSKSKNKMILNKSFRDIKLGKIPKINGSPDGFIDLDKDVVKPGAMGLMKRFIKHIALKPKVNVEEKISVTVSEINENGEIINLKEETIELKTGDKLKPGETRIHLKASLQQKIAQSRELQLAKRLEEYKLNEEVYDSYLGEKDDCGGDLLENEEEEAILSNSSATESEPEEDDIVITDKNKEKNPFLDEEAEESQNENESAVEEDGDTSDDESEDDFEPPDVIGLVSQPEESLDETNKGEKSKDGFSTSQILSLCSGTFGTQPADIVQLENSETNDQTESLHLVVPEDYSLDLLADVERKNNDTDEDSDEEIGVKKIVKKNIKLTFSDDEDEESNTKEDVDDDVDLAKGDEEVEDEEEEEVQEEEEELEANEDEFVEPLANVKSYFDAEAELSGSEWGSADEDDNEDLDQLEQEQGDEEKINERHLKSELEKIHMKEILAEDKREIRILQELLLEDGELHSDGPKRQRQFRWYNQDNNGYADRRFLDGFENGNHREVEEEEDESWRKTRLERENFLRDYEAIKMKEEVDNKLSKIGTKTNLKEPPKAVPVKSPNPNKQFSLITKRGSFLNRGEKILSKIAELTSVSAENPLGNTRNNRNMVFSIVTPPKEEIIHEMAVKRKAETSVTSAAKKLKFTSEASISQKRGSLFEVLRQSDL